MANVNTKSAHVWVDGHCVTLRGESYHSLRQRCEALMAAVTGLKTAVVFNSRETPVYVFAGKFWTGAGE